MTGRHLGPDRRGVTAIEFALLSPVFFLLLLGGLEAAHTLYVQVVLVGQIQKAGRDVTLEGSSSDAQILAIENQVRANVRTVMSTAQVDFTLNSVHDYARVTAPMEEFKDLNSNGKCEKPEEFVDYNNNGVLDDGKVNGRGGPKDVVMLTGKVSYDRIGLGRYFPWNGNRVELQSTTLLRNQPSGLQSTPPTVTCP